MKPQERLLNFYVFFYAEVIRQCEIRRDVDHSNTEWRKEAMADQNNDCDEREMRGVKRTFRSRQLEPVLYEKTSPEVVA